MGSVGFREEITIERTPNLRGAPAALAWIGHGLCKLKTVPLPFGEIGSQPDLPAGSVFMRLNSLTNLWRGHAQLRHLVWVLPRRAIAKCAPNHPPTPATREIRLATRRNTIMQVDQCVVGQKLLANRPPAGE